MMDGHRLNSTAVPRFPWAFFLLVFAISILPWTIGPVAERLLTKGVPINVPLSSLMAFCPIIAALILVQRESGWDGAKKLLKRSFDLRLKRRIWYVPVLLLMPTFIVLQSGWMNRGRRPIPDPQFPALMVPVFVAIFFIAAIGEETGWQGYAIDRLQGRWSALTASIILGTVWATWHIVPLIQLGRTPAQIVAQCVDMVARRILIVWLYNNTGKSVSAAVLYHTMYNVSTLLLPNFGLHYDPLITSVLAAIAAITVTFLWGPKTLARYRYARTDGAIWPRAGDAQTELPDREA
jgi:membrane protease YdiL (CAAX protease family)